MQEDEKLQFKVKIKVIWSWSHVHKVQMSTTKNANTHGWSAFDSCSRTKSHTIWVQWHKKLFLKLRTQTLRPSSLAHMLVDADRWLENHRPCFFLKIHSNGFAIYWTRRGNFKCFSIGWRLFSTPVCIMCSNSSAGRIIVFIWGDVRALFGVQILRTQDTSDLPKFGPATLVRKCP